MGPTGCHAEVGWQLGCVGAGFGLSGVLTCGRCLFFEVGREAEVVAESEVRAWEVSDAVVVFDSE